MANGWTSERRARQAAAIHRWKPWKTRQAHATSEGKKTASRNAWRGGERPALRELLRVLRTADRLSH